MIGPAPSPQAKALRLSPPPRPEVLRLDVRFWVRVAIDTSLAGFAVSTDGGRATFRSETHSANRSPCRLDAVRGFPWLRGRGSRLGGVAGRRFGHVQRFGRS